MQSLRPVTNVVPKPNLCQALDIVGALVKKVSLYVLPMTRCLIQRNEANGCKMKYVVLSVLLSSCMEDANIANYTSSELTYFRDTRTKLCFAMRTYDRSLTIANVPCTDEVEQQIRITEQSGK